VSKPDQKEERMALKKEQKAKATTKNSLFERYDYKVPIL